MSKHKIGYVKGLNKDIAKDKYTNQHYYDANNIRVITSNGLSSGSIENEKGNKLLFSFPTVGKRIKVNIEFGVSTGSVTINATTVSYDITQDNESFYNELINTAAIATLISNNDIYIFINDNGVFIQILNSATTSSFTNTVGTAGSNYSTSPEAIYICGWCRLNEWIIVFTSNSETLEPTNALCQIWKFKFTDGSRTLISGASLAGVLDNTEHLIYNDYLNYSTITYIRDTVTNYETGNKGRVYWTDFYNQIRVINIFDVDTLSLKPTDLDLISEVTLAKPVIQTIANGGSLPTSCAIQYYYKLLDTDGRETIFSPGSQVMILNEELTNDLSLVYHDIKATTPNTVNNKSITIEINDVDTDYNIIEYYAVLWFNQDSPLIYKVGEDNVTSSSLTFTHSTMDSAIPIPFVSFMSIGVPFTCKTIATNNKTLDAGNIKETSFDIDFEARAFRFNTDATPNFDLFEADGSSANYTVATMSTVPETSDAINPTNDDTNVTYNYENTSNRQIYQSDGSTIGGEGVNISYTFTTNGRNASDGSDDLSTSLNTYVGYNQTTERVGLSEYDLGETNEDGTTLSYNFENELNAGKSSKLNSLYTGYSRGEVYRFGVVFFSKQGQRSFVKWIGDIKFPDPTLSDTYKIQDSTDKTTNANSTAGQVLMYELGINFTIDITSIKNQISGFKYVRVKREQSDKTRLGTGVVTNFVNYADGSSNADTQNPYTLLRRYVWGHPTDPYPPGNTRDRAISGIMNLFGLNYGDDVPVAPDNDINLVLNDSPDILGDKGDPTATVNGYNKIWLNLTSPESEFRDYTNFTSNPTTDFIRDYGYYTCYEQVTNDDSENLKAIAEDIRIAQLVFLYRAKQFTSLSSLTQTTQNHLVAAQRYLTNGEVIGNYQQGTLANAEDTALVGTAYGHTSTGIEAILNTSYSLYADEIPLGLGSTKQFLRLSTTSSGHITTGTSLNVKTIALGDIRNAEVTVVGAADDYQGLVRYFKEVAYCRIITNQYGGNTYVARSKNVYIDSGHYQLVTPLTTSTFTATVYGGDTYTVSHAREYLHQYFTNPDSLPFEEPGSGSFTTRLAIAFQFCAECSVNTAYRLGEYWGGVSQNPAEYFKGSVNVLKDRGDLSIYEQFTVLPLYQQENNVRTDYIAKDFLLDTVNKFPNRIKVSNIKIDGELTDNWRRFPVNQFTDVNGSLGEIHKLISFKSNLLFFQDRGYGNLPILERAMIQDVTGAALILGNGDLIGKWQYVTETSGTCHQHSVVASDKTLYYYDSLQAKLCTASEKLSEQLGLGSYFHNDLLELIRVSDDLYKANPIGVVSVYDKKNERVFFTFLGGNVIKDERAGYYDILDIVLYNSIYYRCLVQGNYTEDDLTNTTYFEVLLYYKKGVTISFNEKLNDFESFHSFKPGNYLQYDDKLISINHNTRNSGYIHEENSYGSFYDNLYPSDIVLVVMPNPNIISIFNEIEYYSEISIDKENVVGETLNSIHLWNNHQNTGKITLAVSTLVKQRFQVWRHKFKRDLLGVNGDLKPRMRNYYILLKISFDNNSNKRLVLSDITISYTPTKM